MIIDKNISQYLILHNETILNALKKIEANEDGIIFCINDDGLLLGMLTDGDFRRWAIQSGANSFLEMPILKIINKNIIKAKEGDSVEKIEELLNEKIKYVPLVDDYGRCIAIARARSNQLMIEDKKIGIGHPAYIIAEIGNNHNGDLAMAYKLVDQAIIAGADCAKFQMRDLDSLYSNRGNASDIKEDLGSQYTLDLLSRFQLSVEDLYRVFDYCHKRGITPLCTPWDIKSVDALSLYGMPAYKVASADLTNHDLYRKIAGLGKPMICSTGMSNDQEILEAINLLNSVGAQYALLHCNSTYPAPFKDLNLSYMDVLRDLGKCPVGYSSHDRGGVIAAASVALGANIIEKHFTLDRMLEGNDHRVSLLPHEFAQMVQDIRNVEDAIGRNLQRKMSQGEIMNREILGKSLCINLDLEIGEVIESHMLDVKSPGSGLQPNQKDLVVGKKIGRTLKKGDILYKSDLGNQNSALRTYNFQNRKFGIPIRYHDYNSFTKLTNIDLVEFHLSYKDLEENVNRFFSEKSNLSFLVHAPELFAGDHILDLCSTNETYRSKSIENLSKVVDVTRSLNKWFPSVIKPKIIVNVGGFSLDAPLDRSERADRYEMVLDSLRSLHSNDVEFLPQTMPPFPWHFGGQRFQNLFIDPYEIEQFCKEFNYSVCLDISHSKLACNHFHWSFRKFLELVGPCSSHLHIADSSGVDGEGLQIGDGDIDFVSFGEDIKRYAPNASFIPEIWQGHKEGGEGFWIALDRLESNMN